MLLQAVLAVIRDGVPIVQVADRFDVSRQAVHRSLRWYETQGLVGLADRSHRPPRCSHQMDPAVEVWVLEARRRNPDWGPRRLVHEASRAGIDPAPSPSGIYRALKRAELIDPQARRRRDRRFRRWERGGPMELWQMDVVGGVLLSDGREAKILTGIDNHSRFVVCTGLMIRATASPVMGISEGTIIVSEYEPPRRVVFRVTMGKMEPTTTFTVELVGWGSRVTRRIDMEPPGLMRLMAPFMGGTLRKSNASFLANLKRVLEAG